MVKKKRIWHFSDTHEQEQSLKIPNEDFDIAIFSGDEANNRSPVLNEGPARKFLKWYSEIPNFKHKIFVAGNHSSAIANKLIKRKEIEDLGIIYLENESVEIEGLKIWGSPYSPTFHDWWFMLKRSKLYNLWQMIPEDTDIVISHGPPKGVLDVSEKEDRTLEYCGCNALLNRMLALQPKLCLFGHIHVCQNNMNAGTRTIANCKTLFSNGSCVTDGKFNMGVTSHGNIIEI